MVTKRELTNEDEIRKSAEIFVTEVKALFLHCRVDSILSTDRTGLQLELG